MLFIDLSPFQTMFTEYMEQKQNTHAWPPHIQEMNRTHACTSWTCVVSFYDIINLTKIHLRSCMQNLNMFNWIYTDSVRTSSLNIQRSGTGQEAQYCTPLHMCDYHLSRSWSSGSFGSTWAHHENPNSHGPMKNPKMQIGVTIHFIYT